MVARRTSLSSGDRKAHRGPAAACRVTCSIADVTAFSQRRARGRPDCCRYQSACSRTSAMAAALNTSRYFVTGRGPAGAESKLSLYDEFQPRGSRFFGPWRRQRAIAQMAETALFVLAKFANVFAGRAPITRGDLSFGILLEGFGQ